MEGTIKYILTLHYDRQTIVRTWGNTKADMEDLFATLRNCRTMWNDFELLDTQRMVATAEGKVIYTKVWTVPDDSGLTIYDMYQNVLESYIAPEPQKKRYKVIRNETWTNDIEVEAESEDDAIRIVDQMVADGQFDVLDGWNSDVDHEVYDA